MEKEVLLQVIKQLFKDGDIRIEQDTYVDHEHYRSLTTKIFVGGEEIVSLDTTIEG